MRRDTQGVIDTKLQTRDGGQGRGEAEAPVN